jgi:lipopolysaccharide transport system ATP-binding protein
MYVRLAFAVAAHLESEILIVDEVLAVGDVEFQKKCLGKMGEVSHSEGRTVLFVSHNLESIKLLCSKSLLMVNGLMNYFGGTVDVIKKYHSGNEKIRSNNQKIDFLDYLNVENTKDFLKIDLVISENANFKNKFIGLQILNDNGLVVFGFNPRSHPKLSVFSNESFLRIGITNPRLNIGRYYLSLWIGDGIDDIFLSESEFCFDINSSNLYSEESEYNYLEKNGSVIPRIVIL